MPDTDQINALSAAGPVIASLVITLVALGVVCVALISATRLGLKLVEAFSNLNATLTSLNATLAEQSKGLNKLSNANDSLARDVQNLRADVQTQFALLRNEMAAALAPLTTAVNATHLEAAAANSRLATLESHLKGKVISNGTPAGT